MDFPLKDKSKQEKLCKRIKLIKRILYFKNKSLKQTPLFKRPFLFLYKMLLTPFSCHFLCATYEKRVIKNSKMKNADTNVFWTSGGVYSYEKETHPASMFDNLIEVPFGTTFISIPCEYDDFLRTTYGSNYMIPLKRIDCDLDRCAILVS